MGAGERLPGTPEPMHYWTGHRGVAIAGDSWGDPDGQLVVLQHGGGQTRHAWKGTGEILGRAGCHVVALDARGHGDSGWAPDGEYGTDAMVEDLRCVLAALGRPRPVLVGASMGGVTSLIAAGEGRVEAAALVMVDVAPRIEPEGAANIIAFMERNPDGFASLEEVAEAIASYQPHRPRRRSLDGLAKNVRLAPDGRYRWHWDPAMLHGREPLEAQMQRMERAAARLRIPTLLVRGGMSDVLTEAGVQSFLRLCPHAEYAQVGEAAHMVAGDRNDLFAEAVVSFLARLQERA